MCVCVLSDFSRVRLFATLRSTVARLLCPLGFSRQGYWSGSPCPPLGDLPNPGIELAFPVAAALYVDSLPLSYEGSSKTTCTKVNLWASLVAQLVKNRLQCRRLWFDSWVGKIPWRRDRLPTPVFLGYSGGSDGEESTCMWETWVWSLS